MSNHARKPSETEVGWTKLQESRRRLTAAALAVAHDRLARLTGVSGTVKIEGLRPAWNISTL